MKTDMYKVAYTNQTFDCSDESMLPLQNRKTIAYHYLLLFV